MRVALAALLFSEPDLLLLDEPSNHLDLEAAVWLESFLKSYRGSLIVVSHERDLLNNVVDYILHLERGGLTLYHGNYDSFVAAAARARRPRPRRRAGKQEAKAKKLQAYVDRWRYKAHTARQAQSRLKALARDGADRRGGARTRPLVFDFPSPKELQAAADRARRRRGRLCARRAGAVAARSAHRSRRPHGAAGPQRQRQDDAWRACSPGSSSRWRARSSASRQIAGRLFRPASDRGAESPTTRRSSICSGCCRGRSPARCAASSAASASQAKRPISQCASSPAASVPGCRSRSSRATRRIS